MVINIEDIAKLKARLNRFAKTKALKVAAQVVKEQELRQTEVGRDYKGAFFAPYKKSTVYKRKLLGLRTDRVNLTVTGRLKKSRYYDEITKELRYDDEHEQVAEYLQNGTEFMKSRKFVGVSNLDIPEIVERVSSAITSEFS